MIEKVYRKKFKVLVALLVILVIFAALLGYDLIAEYAVEFSARTTPSYAREDLSDVLAKERFSQEDYAFLYRQTGLGRAAIDALERERIPEFQDALFYEGSPHHTKVTFFSKRDRMFYKGGDAPLAPLEAGDVLLSSATHTAGWRHGHAAIVLDSEGDLLESIVVGQDSCITKSGARWFATTANFILLRLKDVSAQERAAVAEAARQNLVGVPYSLTVGIFSKKDQGDTPSATQCAHIVWQAFYNFGYDIDSNGGALVTARDIARSDLFEVVQVYGFDVDKLW